MFQVFKDRGLGFGFEVWAEFTTQLAAVEFARSEWRPYTPVEVMLDGTRVAAYSHACDVFMNRELKARIAQWKVAA